MFWAAGPGSPIAPSHAYLLQSSLLAFISMSNSNKIVVEKKSVPHQIMPRNALNDKYVAGLMAIYL